MEMRWSGNMGKTSFCEKMHSHEAKSAFGTTWLWPIGFIVFQINENLNSFLKHSDWQAMICSSAEVLIQNKFKAARRLPQLTLYRLTISWTFGLCSSDFFVMCIILEEGKSWSLLFTNLLLKLTARSKYK